MFSEEIKTKYNGRFYVDYFYDDNPNGHLMKSGYVVDSKDDIKLFEVIGRVIVQDNGDRTSDYSELYQKLDDYLMNERDNKIDQLGI